MNYWCLSLRSNLWDRSPASLGLRLPRLEGEKSKNDHEQMGCCLVAGAPILPPHNHTQGPSLTARSPGSYAPTQPG